MNVSILHSLRLIIKHMTKKAKTNSYFPEDVQRNWEASDGVNFAIALARITNWLLHVDWWSPTDNTEKVENMKSLRVYIGDNSNYIYDIRGKYTIATYSNNIIRPIIQKRGANYGDVVTRFYSENKIFSLPLRVKPDEDRIQKAQEFINNCPDFLEKIPKRKEPNIPAHTAAKFTFGYCNPFATALSDLKGYKPMSIIAKEYNKIFDWSKLGYVHSCTFDKDNNAIDVWGKDSITNIVHRFGITKYDLDEAEHYKVDQKLRNNSPEKYNEVYNESVAIINEFFI